MTGPGQPRKENGYTCKLDTRVDNETHQYLKKIKQIDGDASMAALIRRILEEKVRKAVSNNYRRR